MICADINFFLFFCIFSKIIQPESYPLCAIRITCSTLLCTMPFENLMSFFLGLADRTLLYLYLRSDSVSSPAWKQVFNSSQPYLHDFMSPLAFTITACRVLISRGCFAFSTSLSASSTHLFPYLPCMWARHFGSIISF